MNLRCIIPYLALITTTAACGVKSVGELDDTSGTDGESSGSATDTTDPTATASSSASSASTTATTDPTATATTDPTDTATGTDSTGDTGDCPPMGSVCDPQEQLGQDDVQWMVDEAGLIEAQLIDIPCVVAEFTDDGETLSIVLECDEGELSQHTLVVPHNPITPLNVGMGSSVLFTYLNDTPFWTNEWFSLRAMDGRFIIAGVLGSTLLPEAVPELFAPVQVTLIEDACEVDMLTACDPNACSDIRREALAVAVDADEATIYDGNSGTVGTTTQFTFVVGEAAAFFDNGMCTDIPGSWYAMIAYDSSEG